jgi:hypothetical protein
VTKRYATPHQHYRLPVIPVTEVILARAPRALEGEVKGGSSLEGAGKERLWRKGSRKGVDQGAQRVDALLSHLSCL